MTPQSKVIGRSLARLEDAVLLKGQGRFVDDLSFPDQVHMRVVRSEHAHGKIVSLDASVARSLDGVIAVWTGDDVRQLPPIDFRDAAAEVLKPYRQPVLAQDKVRYVGEPVAVVFAINPYIAEDAAALVAVEIDELAPLLSASAAPGEFASVLSTEATVVRNSYGDAEAAF